MTFILLLFYLAEAFGKLSIVYGVRSQAQLVIKTTLLLFILYGIIRQARLIKKELIFIFLLIISFIVGQSFIDPSFNRNSVYIASRYLFPILILLYFNLYPVKAGFKDVLFKIFEGLFICNGILIIVGLIFSIDAFETYRGERFGYNGLIQTSATATYSYLCVLSYYLLKLRQNLFKDPRALFIIITSLLVGTKSLYAAVILITLFSLFQYRMRYKKYIMPLLIMGLLGGAYYIFFVIGESSNIAKKYGVLSSILSYRDQLLMNKTMPYVDESWSSINYFFGGVSDFSLRSQMDFIDIFFFWGILGGLLYLYVYQRLLINFKVTILSVFIGLMLLLIIAIAGNFFAYTTVSIYLLVLRAKLLSYQDFKP